jgi:hypothetical protein
MVMNLSEFGFQKVGKCALDESLNSGVRFRINELGNERVVYAYTVDDEVKYIGVCDSTGTTLKDRMSRYQGMVGAGTNERIAELIKECLRQGKEVEILAWKPDTEVEFKGLKVDLVKGLENPLIQGLRPEWNIKA